MSQEELVSLSSVSRLTSCPQEMSDLQFKGYAIQDTKKYTDFEVIEFK